MKYKIYLITNVINGKKYVGQTTGKISRRWTNHKSSAKNGKDNYFYRAIRKYGPENFEVVFLEDWNTLEEANDAERWWIKILDTTNEEFGYNSLMGGHFQPSPATGRRISEGKLRAFKEDPEHREAVSKAISKARKGIPRTEQEKEAISKSLKGKPTNRPNYVPSEETKEKTRQSMIKAYEEGRHRKTEGLKKGTILGPMSDEEKLKRSEGVKAARAKKFWSTKKKQEELCLTK